MRNVLILPPHIFKLATDAAQKQGVSLVELCQVACVCKIDEVIEEQPTPVQDAHIYTREPATGLEA